MTLIKGPDIFTEAGEIGLPQGQKEAGKRVDFRAEQFDIAIETKGYRLAWTRASQCPCISLHDQTDHPDPNCTICEGSGVIYFRPDQGLDVTEIGAVTETQEAIILRNDATVIRGIMTGLGRGLDPWDKGGRIYEGEASVTVRHENLLGYYDKLVILDARVVYSQIVYAGEEATTRLRYPAVQMNLLRSADKTYRLSIDYTLENGDIVWLDNSAPPPTTKLAAHYYTHPTYLVMQHPHAIRQSLTKSKIANPQTPRGDITPLPIQAMVRLEFVPPRA